MATKVPLVKFNNGKFIPILGLGTWKLKPTEAAAAVKNAIDAGYRLIDTACISQNEKEIGQAIAEKIAGGTIKRENLYIVGKLWSTFHHPEMVEVGLQESLDNLRLQYFDLYLIQWPLAMKKGETFLVEAEGSPQFGDVDFLETWKAMEAMYKKGLVKSIGLSNFNRQQVERVLKHAKILPVTNQVECHPHLNQSKMSNFLQSRGITLMAYSPLGSEGEAKPGDKILLEEPKIKTVAEKYLKTPAQVLLKYQIQRGHIAIPKTVNKEGLQQNMEIFDFELSHGDMKRISSLSCRLRLFEYPEVEKHRYSPTTKRDLEK